ncbi:unnamed protein product [Arabis nemorensis]|uniref:Uncharacterized protein n=1 Tax=Arabis nemorensis TaxID=586526 RepID=A0A565B094_9BRAS|nr:unnamed protein product [Arabis nemorensis]
MPSSSPRRDVSPSTLPDRVITRPGRQRPSHCVEASSRGPRHQRTRPSQKNRNLIANFIDRD